MKKFKKENDREERGSVYGTDISEERRLLHPEYQDGRTAGGNADEVRYPAEGLSEGEQERSLFRASSERQIDEPSAKNSKASKPEPKQKISKTATKTAKKTTAVKKSAVKEKVPVKKIPALKKSEIKKESNVVSKTPDVSVVKASAKPVALKSKDYGDDKIIHLDALEHIRLRSGMYIGRLGDGSNQNDGIYILLKEIVD